MVDARWEEAIDERRNKYRDLAPTIYRRATILAQLRDYDYHPQSYTKI